MLIRQNTRQTVKYLITKMHWIKAWQSGKEVLQGGIYKDLSNTKHLHICEIMFVSVLHFFFIYNV